MSTDPGDHAADAFRYGLAHPGRDLWDEVVPVAAGGISRAPAPWWTRAGEQAMNVTRQRTVIDLNNMALHVQFKGGEPKLVELLQRAAKMLEEIDRADEAKTPPPGDAA